MDRLKVFLITVAVAIFVLVAGFKLLLVVLTLAEAVFAAVLKLIAKYPEMILLIPTVLFGLYMVKVWERRLETDAQKADPDIAGDDDQMDIREQTPGAYIDPRRLFNDEEQEG